MPIRNHNVSLDSILPFRDLVDYDVELNFESSKKRIQKLMDDHRLLSFIKENKLSQILDSDDSITCKYHDHETFNSLNISENDHVNVFSMNIRSLPAHAGELVAFLSMLKTKFQIIVLSEIGAKNISVVERLLPGYILYYITPERNKCGGVGIYICDSIENVHVLDDARLLKTCSCMKCHHESLCINFTFRGRDCSVLGVYNHPKGNITHFAEALKIAVNKLDKRRTAIIAGDFNIDVLRYNDKTVLEYITMLLSERFLPFITLPTRITSHSATCIDHIFVRNPSNPINSQILSGIFYCDISDHLPCFTSIKLASTNTPVNRPKVRIFSEKNCGIFKARINGIKWDDVYVDNIDWYQSFIAKVKQAYECAFPLVTVSRKRMHDKPWVTGALKGSIAHNHRLYRLSIRNPSMQNITKYKDYNKLLKKCLRSTETTYYRNLFENNKKSTLNMWKVLGPVINPGKRKRTNNITKIFANGRVIKDENMIPEIMNQYFCNVGQNLQSDIPDHAPDSFRQYLPHPEVDSFQLTPVTYADVLKEINQLNPTKSPGPDSIGGKIILLCPEIFAYNLTIIFNKYIQLGKYPEAMKLAKVIPIYKKGEHSLPNNYRPISLLSTFNKLFEKLICKKIRHFLHVKDLLYKFQFGFRDLYSTMLSLVETTDSIRGLIDDKNYVLSLFVDLTKAFDTVDHEILLQKLEYYGIRGHANNFLRSYLSNRKQYTVVGNKSSEVRNISCGVPQGSVLGPLLFLLYVNDIHMCVDNSLTRLFADDTGLHMYNKNIHELISFAKTQIRKLFKWCISNNLTINYTKTSFILFHAKNKPVPDNFNDIDVDGILIKRVSSAVYLGVTFDEKLNWSDHVTYVCNALLKFFGIFNKIKHMITKKIARQLYCAFIYSRIAYGLEVYGHCSEHNLQKIQIIQNKLLKLLLTKKRRTSTNEIHKDMNILKVKDIQNANIICFVKNCLIKRCPKYFFDYFTIRTSQYEIRDTDLNVMRCRIELGSLSTKIVGAKLWNNIPEDIKVKKNQLNFRKIICKHYISLYPVDEED